jgi:hypothetical protein
LLVAVVLVVTETKLAVAVAVKFFILQRFPLLADRATRLLLVRVELEHLRQETTEESLVDQAVSMLALRVAVAVAVAVGLMTAHLIWDFQAVQQAVVTDLDSQTSWQL